MALVKAKETKWNEEKQKWESKDIMIDDNSDNPYVEDEVIPYFETKEELMFFAYTFYDLSPEEYTNYVNTLKD